VLGKKYVMEKGVAGNKSEARLDRRSTKRAVGQTNHPRRRRLGGERPRPCSRLWAGEERSQRSPEEVGKTWQFDWNTRGAGSKREENNRVLPFKRGI